MAPMRDDLVKIVHGKTNEYAAYNFMKAFCLILTDSGGIQEEAPSPGKLALVMRDTPNGRPEGMKASTLRLAGTSESAIYENFSRLLTDEKGYGGW